MQAVYVLQRRQQPQQPTHSVWASAPSRPSSVVPAQYYATAVRAAHNCQPSMHLPAVSHAASEYYCSMRAATAAAALCRGRPPARTTEVPQHPGNRALGSLHLLQRAAEAVAAQSDCCCAAPPPPIAVRRRASSAARDISPVSASPLEAAEGGPPSPAPSAAMHTAAQAERRPESPCPSPPALAALAGFSCKRCSPSGPASTSQRAFATRADLIAHQRSAHGLELRHVCKVCGAAFGRSGNLNNHVRTVHHRIQPYGCEQCGKRFGEEGNLHKHVKIVHQRQRPFACSMCGKRCGRKNDMLKHVRTVHQALRPYTCGVCGGAFTEKSKLRKHMSRRHAQHAPVAEATSAQPQR